MKIVIEMVTYASECGRRSKADHLRFSEFCVLVTEMRYGYILKLVYDNI